MSPPAGQPGRVEGDGGPVVEPRAVRAVTGAAALPRPGGEPRCPRSGVPHPHFELSGTLGDRY